jgi:HPt (histidine-containing phosphotransfer) domain-containing protein
MSALINWGKVSELRDEVGAEDFAEVVELFLEEVEETISQLGAAGRSVEHDLHFLKGSALNLGFADFSELCRAGEAAAAAGQADGINLDDVVSTYGISRDAFLTGLSEKPGN